MNSFKENFYILGIESSCDETAAAIVSSNKTILSNIVYSQIIEHKKFNGVVPEIAARAHLEKIDFVVNKALKDANLDISDINAVAATCGPGLIGGVIVGSTFAKGISISANIPFIAINHIEAHALTIRLTENSLNFPYLLLLASGGHCQICIVYSCDYFEVIGVTLDDSVGESFDKVAKMLDLGYPGGPIIEKIAEKGDENRFNFPHPLCNLNSKDINSMNFSFSGLKTAVKIVYEKEKTAKEKSETKIGTIKQIKCDICAGFQKTVAEILTYKMKRALIYCESKKIKLNAVGVGGGVAANKYIRDNLKDLAESHNIRFVIPPVPLCTDNGAMIAWNGVEKFKKQKFDTIDFRPRPRWSFSK